MFFMIIGGKECPLCYVNFPASYHLDKSPFLVLPELKKEVIMENNM